MFGICCTPPSPRAFQALLYDIAMCALNLARANGKILCERILIVELLGSMVQIAEALAHGGVAIGDAVGFKVSAQGLQDNGGSAGF